MHVFTYSTICAGGIDYARGYHLLSLNDFHQDRLVPQLQPPFVFSLPIHEMLHLAVGNRILPASQAMLAIFLASLHCTMHVYWLG
jgi:hypothetical protein